MRLPDVTGWGESDRLDNELASVGFFLSGHPLDDLLNGGMRADQSISFQAMQEKLKQLVDIIRADPAVATVVVTAAASVVDLRKGP